MSTTPETTTSGGSANVDHHASDRGIVASRNTCGRRKQKLKPVATTNETMKFEGKCDDLSGYIYNCADLKQAADMYSTSTTKEISEYIRQTYKYGGEMRQVIMKLRLPNMPIPADIPAKSLDGEKAGHLEKQTN